MPNLRISEMTAAAALAAADLLPMVQGGANVKATAQQMTTLVETRIAKNVATPRAGRMLSFTDGDAINVTGFTVNQVAAMLAAATINGTGGGHVTLIENQTATEGQTVFNLTTLSYVPGVNAIRVSVDGRRISDFTETNATRVTVSAGLKAGQELTFEVGRFVTSGVDSQQLGYTADVVGALARSQFDYNESVRSLRSFCLMDNSDETVGLGRFFDDLAANGGIGIMPAGDIRVTSLSEITLASRAFLLLGSGAEGTRIIVSSTFTGATPALRIVGSNTQPGFHIQGFSIRKEGSGGACTGALQIGSENPADPVIAGFGLSTIKNFMTADLKVGVDIVHARLLRLEDVSVWNNNVVGANDCVLIRQNGKFTGDITFDSCNLVQTRGTDRHCIRVHSSGTTYNNANGDGSVTGLKLRTVYMHGGGQVLKVYAGGSSRVMDMWLEAGCQVDQEVDVGVYLEANNAGAVIEDIHVQGLYVNKTLDAGILATSTGTGGTIRDVWLNGNRIDRAEQEAISVFGTATADFHIIDNEIIDCKHTAGAISINGTQGVTAALNRARTGEYAQTPYYLIDLLSGTSKITCIGNDGQGATSVSTIRDLSGDVPKTVYGNLGDASQLEVALTVTASPFNYKNTSGSAKSVYITGGTVSGITINGRAVPTTSGIYHTVPPGVTMSVSYSVAPAMFTTGI